MLEHLIISVVYSDPLSFTCFLNHVHEPGRVSTVQVISRPYIATQIQKELTAYKM